MMDVKKINRAVATILVAITAAILVIEGTWGQPMHLSSPFIVLLLLSLISIAIYLYYGSPSRGTHGGVFGTHGGVFGTHGGVFSHLGFFLVVIAAIASYPWNESGQAIVFPNTPTRLAYTPEGQPMALPFELTLDSFYIDYYEDGVSPKQYTSHLTILGLTDKDTTTHSLVTSVNHPARYQGYHLYQDSYDRDNQSFVVIKVVRQPLYWLTLIGFALLAIGAVLYMASKWQSGWFIVIAIVLAIVFALIAVARIRFGILMPALRSLWFIPHLIIYMLAYATLALTLILAIIQFWVPLRGETYEKGLKGLLVTSSSLLLLGMLCGAVWAQQAWGDYWAWDPKECWAAATWMLTLAAIHTKTTQTTQTTQTTKTTQTTQTTKTTRSQIIKTIFIILAFVAMNITWYGVNHLPSAPTSIHTYNK